MSSTAGGNSNGRRLHVDLAPARQAQKGSMNMIRYENARRSFFTILLCLTVGAGAMAQEATKELESKLRADPNDESTLMELGRIYHDRGVAGDEDAVDEAFRCFDRALAIDSTNAVALAYRGSLWTLRARDSWWPPNKLSYMRKGAAEMDLAVGRAPLNMMVRLIRGINSVGLPGFLGRLPTALEDFIVLLKHPELPVQTKELKVAIYYYAGLAHKKADDYEKARELFGKALEILPGSDFAKRSGEELKEME